MGLDATRGETGMTDLQFTEFLRLYDETAKLKIQYAELRAQITELRRENDASKSSCLKNSRLLQQR